MLSATVIDPVPAFSASSLSFGTEKTNSGTGTRSVTLTSVGGTSLGITSFAIGGADPPDFTQTNTCSASTAPKATCSITVTFKPTAKGSRTATLVVTDSAQNSQESIAFGHGGLKSSQIAARLAFEKHKRTPGAHLARTAARAASERSRSVLGELPIRHFAGCVAGLVRCDPLPSLKGNSCPEEFF
jgi:hypothetical protein